MNKAEENGQEKGTKRLIVKGYMRPDGASYYVSIPKEIREVFGLKGGEYFIMEAKTNKKKISLKLVKFRKEVWSMEISEYERRLES